MTTQNTFYIGQCFESSKKTRTGDNYYWIVMDLNEAGIPVFHKIRLVDSIDSLPYIAFSEINLATQADDKGERDDLDYFLTRGLRPHRILEYFDPDHRYTQIEPERLERAIVRLLGPQEFDKCSYKSVLETGKQQQSLSQHA